MKANRPASPLWSGTLDFSLVRIPVSLFPATREAGLELDFVDRRDLARVEFRRVNVRSGEPVAWDDIVRAYRFGDGEMVVLSDADFRLANPVATERIDMQGFVALNEIAPHYFDLPYHVLPDGEDLTAYALFRGALQRAAVAGIGTLVLRSRQQLCAVYPYASGLLLTTLRYAHELSDTPEPERAAAEGVARAGADERSMAAALIDEMRLHWDPHAWRDTFTGDVLQRVEQKIASGDALRVVEAEPAPGAPAADAGELAEQLRQSLEQRQHVPPRPPDRERRTH